MRDVYEELIHQLEGIRESLVELSVVTLREAIESGAGSRPMRDKKLAQATRAVEKALEAVRAAEASGD